MIRYSNKSIFVTERYALKNLESELNIGSTEPSNFHGLEPYELAEFRVVRNTIIEKLDIKQKQLAKGMSILWMMIKLQIYFIHKYLNLKL